MGVPAIRSSLFRRRGASGLLRDSLTAKKTEEENGDETPPGFLVESSDTDVSQGSWSLGTGYSQLRPIHESGSAVRWMPKVRLSGLR